MKKNKNFTLASQGLKYKLRIAFYLMSVLPLLVCIYLIANYILPQRGVRFRLDMGLLVLISIFIAIIGFFVVKEIIDRILSVNAEAKLIVAGDINHRIEVLHEDEVGDLCKSLNELTQRIRSNMDELRSYSERTTEINLEIQRRVLVLSSLLQLSALISQAAKLEEILKIVVEKSRLLAHSDIAYLFLQEEEGKEFIMQAADGMDADYLSQIKLNPEDAIFNRLIKANKMLVIDKKNVLARDLAEAFSAKFKLKNTLALPVYLRGKVIGILGIGNNRDQFLYKKDDMELMDIFSKQVAIAVENDILMHKVEKLEIRDALTGLYNERFIYDRLQDEIKRAISYHRPCSFILLDVDDFQKIHETFGLLQSEGVLKKIASLVKDSLSEVDRLGRFGDHEFAVILPEKNKRHAREIADNIRKKIELVFGEEKDPNKRITISGGVSENPLDGVEAQELIDKAKELVNAAVKQGKNHILV